MPTQNVNLTETQAEFIRQCVDSGAYNNASELVREALRLLNAQKDEQQAKLELLRAEIQKGYDAHERGDYI
ncbi:MAG: type II toxin-antitoxin system ParD family antitoxin [Candidatus Hydrogenedentes bacterium]|nr:type II toxin-antitoxin system ParD family antitoxin [Candidatus Hydrogenedentota bacterium]